MAHLSGWHHFQHALHHAEACAQDRHKRQFPASDHFGGRLAHRRLNVYFLERKIARRLVAHQHSDLAHQLAELFGTRILIAQEGKLVLNQRMVHDKNLIFHLFSPIYIL